MGLKRLVVIVAFAITAEACGSGPRALVPERLPGVPAGGTALQLAFDVDGSPMTWRGRSIWRLEGTTWRELFTEADLAPGGIAGFYRDPRGGAVVRTLVDPVEFGQPGSAQHFRIDGDTLVPMGGPGPLGRWFGRFSDGTELITDGGSLYTLAPGTRDWTKVVSEDKSLADWSGVILADDTLVNLPSDQRVGVVAWDRRGGKRTLVSCDEPVMQACESTALLQRVGTDGRPRFLIGGVRDARYDLVAIDPATGATEVVGTFGSTVLEDGVAIQFTVAIRGFALADNDDWYALRAEDYGSEPSWLIGGRRGDAEAVIVAKRLAVGAELILHGGFLYVFEYSDGGSLLRFAL